MKPFTKYDEVLSLLKSGGEIFTKRGSAPYAPLYFHIWIGNTAKRVHPSTIKKLINNGVINGYDSPNKYKLKP